MVAHVSVCAPSIFDVIPTVERPGLAIVGTAGAVTIESEKRAGSGKILRSTLRQEKNRVSAGTVAPVRCRTTSLAVWRSVGQKIGKEKSRQG